MDRIVAAADLNDAVFNGLQAAIGSFQQLQVCSQPQLQHLRYHQAIKKQEQAALHVSQSCHRSVQPW